MHSNIHTCILCVVQDTFLKSFTLPYRFIPSTYNIVYRDKVVFGVLIWKST